MRVLMPIGFLIVFIIWIMYRLIIKKDLKKNLNNLYIGLAFIAIWTAVYYLWIN